jgi:uncharacterized protein (TIGR01777 family)
MRVFITGGTGLIGRSLVGRLLERGDQPVIVTRRADVVRRSPAMRPVRVVQGDPSEAGDWAREVDGCDAVMNLVGHGVFAQRWNTNVKRKIRDSRVHSTENVVAAIGNARVRPSVLVQASAIGYYGMRGDEELTEESAPGSDFMAVVCREWQEAAAPAEALGVRLAIIRTGVVLARGEGALGVMTPIFKWLPGGAAPIGSGDSLVRPGSGRQWMSWIHLDDIVGIYLLALDRADAHGPINGTAPNPVRNSEFSKTLAKVLFRPYVPIGPPDLLLQLVLGEVSQIVTKGQRVLPAKAQELGYIFKHPQLLPALQAVFAKPDRPPSPQPPETVHAGGEGHH